MSHACTSILMGVAILVSEILLLPKTVKFPFPTMDYSPLSSKNLIIWNRLKKFMQVGVHVTCMHINFDGCGHSGFGDIATFKTVKFPFPTMDYSPWSSKNVIIWNRLKKFMQVEVNVLCMHNNFDGCRHSGFGDIATFKNGQISLSDHGLQSMIIKKLNHLESAQKIHASRGSCHMHAHQF